MKTPTKWALSGIAGAWLIVGAIYILNWMGLDWVIFAFVAVVVVSAVGLGFGIIIGCLSEDE